MVLVEQFLNLTLESILTMSTGPFSIVILQKMVRNELDGLNSAYPQ